MSKQWSQSDINYLKRFAASKRLDELAQRFDVEVEEVRARLAELKLASKDGPADAGATTDPLFIYFEAGLTAMHEGRWGDAIARFEQVAAESDLLDLSGRARQFLAICRQRQSPGDGMAAREDPFLLAVFHKNQGRYEEALKICHGNAGSEQDERFVYMQASLHCLVGDPEKAASMLEQAIRLNSENRVHAFHDPDFAGLRKRQDYAYLFGLG